MLLDFLQLHQSDLELVQSGEHILEFGFFDQENGILSYIFRPQFFKIYDAQIGAGWGNGYVMLLHNKPPNKQLYAIQQNFSQEITLSEPINGGKGHKLGFDTIHFGMDKETHPKEKVIELTIELLKVVYEVCLKRKFSYTLEEWQNFTDPHYQALTLFVD